MRKMMSSMIAVTLTGMIMIMPLFTCFFMFHQPKMPDEINDFRKYDK
ncbi:MAG: cyclic lactone autoinducer peptide [Lachnospiraceae bacterium]|nr:cyclic lactone autoinducer peptide [Lachnospiraceae bacterium]